MCCCVLALPQVPPITRVPGYQHQCLFCPGAIKSGGYLEPRLIFPAIAHISTSEMDRSPSRWLALRIEYLPAPRVYPTVLWALNEVFATITSPPPHPEELEPLIHDTSLKGSIPVISYFDSQKGPSVPHMGMGLPIRDGASPKTTKNLGDHD